MTDYNNEIVKQTIDKYILDLGYKFVYVGGTIIQRNEFQTYTKILFCEDGFVDENNVPYIMESVVPKGITKRDRILVFYRDDGTRYLIPIDGDNWKLVGNNSPEYVKNIDYGKAKKIVHRNALKVEKEPIKLSKEEKSNLLNEYSKILKRGNCIVAGIFMSLVWFIIIGLITIFSITAIETNDVLGVLVLVIGVLFWILISIFTIRFFYKLPLKTLKNANYKKAILFEGIAKVKPRFVVYGYYYDGSNWTLGYYTIPLGNEQIFENLRYGEIIYRYSKNEYPTNEEMCFFSKK